MESDRGLVKMPSLAKKSMSFLRDAYAMAGSRPSSSQQNLGVHNQHSFQPSQGLSHHFSQGHQQQTHLRPHSPSLSGSWAMPQTHSTPDLASHPPSPQHQSSHSQTLPPHQQLYRYPPAPSHSPPVVSPIGPPTAPAQWSGSNSTIAASTHDTPPPPYNTVAFQSTTAITNSPQPQLQHQEQAQVQKPPPVQIYSPDDFHEIWQSESAAVRPPRPVPPIPTSNPDHQYQAPIAAPMTPSPVAQPASHHAPPQPYQQPSPDVQQSFQHPAPLPHSFSAPAVPSQHQYHIPQPQPWPAVHVDQNYHQPHHGQDDIPAPNPPQLYQHSTWSPQSPQPMQPAQQYQPFSQQYPGAVVSPSANYSTVDQHTAPHHVTSPLLASPHPHHSQTWPQISPQLPYQHQEYPSHETSTQQYQHTNTVQHQQQPLHQQASYFGYIPPTQQISHAQPTTPIPAVAVSPPIAELPTPLPVQTQAQMQYQYQAYQPHPVSTAPADTKIPMNMYAPIQHPAVAELPG